MAAGVIRQTVTTTTGETIELAFWVDDTVTPTAWTPVSTLITTADAAVTFNSNGQATAANSAPVVQASDTSFAYSASATFTPAATSHAAGDCVGAAAEIALAAPSGKRIMITSATLEVDNTTSPSTSFTLYLYNVTPPSATADDAAWDLASGDRASFLGQVEIPQPVDKGATGWIEVHGINKQIKLSGTSVFAYLVNNTTATLVASAHIVTLHAVSV